MLSIEIYIKQEEKKPIFLEYEGIRILYYINRQIMCFEEPVWKN